MLKLEFASPGEVIKPLETPVNELTNMGCFRWVIVLMFI